MVETIDETSPEHAVLATAQLLHDFNQEYDEPTPPVAELAARLTTLVATDAVVALLARDRRGGEPLGVAMIRVQPSLWSPGSEAYLAELYVVPPHRGQGYGRELITTALDAARGRGADYAFLITSEDDELAQRLYEAAGFRRTEGPGGPLMLAYERDL